MRSNQNPSGSLARGVEERAGGKLSVPRMPVEWLDSGSWRLPSGKALAEFALQAGFLAPLLFRTDGFGKRAVKSAAGSARMAAGVARGKQFGKGEGR